MLEIIKLRITGQLYKDIFPLLKNNRITLFLIGANINNKNSLRSKLRVTLEKVKYHGRYFDIYYPEEIFSDLLYNSKLDLLSLENLLASSVHVVVICLESPGAIAELGAFANHDLLSNKLVVIVDERFKKAKSFVRNGPLRFLESKTTSSVIWFNYREGNIDDIVRKTRQTIIRVGRNATIDRNLLNPIVVADFLLILVYTLGPLDGNELISLIAKLESLDTKQAKTIGKSALNTLFKQRAVFIHNNKYFLTKAGHSILLESLYDKNRYAILSVIDKLRVEYLNITLRKVKNFNGRR